MTGIKLAVAIAVMAIVTYIIRLIPLTFFRKKITNPYVKAFLKFVPYAVLSAMTFPDVFSSSGSIISAVIGVIVAFILAYKNKGLLTVSIASCVAVFVVEAVSKYFI